MRQASRRLPLAFSSIALLMAGPLLAAGLQRSFDVRSGGDLVIDAGGARVEIETGGDGATVEIRRRDDTENEILDDYKIDFIHDGDQLRIEVERKRRWRFWSRERELLIRVRIPSIFNVDVRTSGGSVVIADLVGTLKARTSGGSVKLADISGRVDASTSGGSIDIDSVSGPVTARTSGGSIKVGEVRGPIDASTSGGSVRAYISEPPGAASKLSTSGGSVVVLLNEGVGVDLDARSSGGRVATDFDVLVAPNTSGSRGVLVGGINGGGPDLVLRTSGGGIRILRK